MGMFWKLFGGFFVFFFCFLILILEIVSLLIIIWLIFLRLFFRFKRLLIFLFLLLIILVIFLFVFIVSLRNLLLFEGDFLYNFCKKNIMFLMEGKMFLCFLYCNKYWRFFLKFEDVKIGIRVIMFGFLECFLFCRIFIIIWKKYFNFFRFWFVDCIVVWIFLFVYNDDFKILWILNIDKCFNFLVWRGGILYFFFIV